jgi:phage gp29-like protein
MPELFKVGRFPQLSQINPLRGLTMSRVVNLLDRANFGYYSQLAWLYSYVEKRETTMIALKERRQASLGRCDWTIETNGRVAADESMKGAVKAQKEFMEEVYASIDNLEEAWKWLGMATFRQFAHLEKHYNANGTVVHLEPVPQWYMGRRYPSKQWLYDPEAMDCARGTPIEADDWIVREMEGSLGEIGVIFYVWKVMCLKDWSAFTSRFGVPNIFAELDKEIQGPTTGTMQDYLSSITSIVSNGSGALPPGVKVTMMAAGSSDNTPFPVHLDYLDKSLVLAGTGGKLTMLSDSTGIGSGATAAHEGVFDDIATSEASDIAEIIDRSIGIPLLKARFPNQRPLVKFVIRRANETDPNAVADNMWKAKLGGFRYSQEEAEKRLGVKLEKIMTPDEVAVNNMDPNAIADQVESLNRRGMVTLNRDTLEGSMKLIEDVMRESVADIVNDFARALTLENGERDAALEKLEKQLPERLAELNADPVAAKVFETVMAESFTAGLTEAGKSS